MGKLLGAVVRDLVAVGGVAAVIYGVAAIYTPAALILGGMLAVAGSILSGARR